MSARLVMRSERGGNNISFTCRELNSSTATAAQGSKKRPASSKKREKDKRRREIWLQRRNCPSSAGPLLSSQQLQPQQHIFLLFSIAPLFTALFILLIKL
jgi:hypothetical protein